MKIAVLGCGLVGSAIVRDLAASGHTVVCADADAERLESADRFCASAKLVDLSAPSAVRAFVADSHMAVGALPGFMGFLAVRAILETGRPVVDISFFPEDYRELDEVARSAGVTCLVDCGVAPGLSNLVMGRAEARLDQVDSFRCLVGGLPVRRDPPWEYKAPFSPLDVIEEYVRPARLRRSGEELALPALSEPELVELPGVGMLEAFNTDGLRSLLVTSKASNMVEKTLRYPGHRAKVEALRDAGMFSVEPVVVGGEELVPRRVTEALLRETWRLDDDEEELTVMRVEIEGELGGRGWSRRWDLLDRRDPTTGVSSMARTTGYTCTAMVGLVASGAWSTVGAFPPERVGADRTCYDGVVTHLAERGIALRVTG
ncbi:MAG: saccharopine dehydrogenase NADP-binding domain-containing protein [Gemmatimonadetes bacterium]|nr:saccharopine dehydrogenase NADP-binding domain-containing protein [Gemmatimonadota bacterium]